MTKATPVHDRLFGILIQSKVESPSLIPIELNVTQDEFDTLKIEMDKVLMYPNEDREYANQFYGTKLVIVDDH